LNFFNKNYFKILLFTFIYFIIHELTHYLVLVYYGYNSSINWISLIATVKIPPNLPINILFLGALAPYFISFSLIIILFNFRKYLYTKVISTAMFIDFTWNLLMFPIGLLINKPNDFIVFYILGNLWFVLILWIISLLFWVLTLKEIKILKLRWCGFLGRFK